MNATIRAEAPRDIEAIHRVNVAAFGQEEEARLVDALRDAGVLTVSLVAIADGAVVGHIAFSPVTVTRADGSSREGIGLAPMAVRPDAQRRGVGARMITEGLARLRAAGHRFCVVLGHPEYYPGFGFAPASRYGLRWEHPCPDEAFMALALTPDGLDGVEGVVRYHAAFEGV